MKTDPQNHLIIVIPCYNEEADFSVSDYYAFLRSSDKVKLVFVNDGSKDNSLLLLREIQDHYPEKVKVVTYEKNKGKAEAVRQGMLYCNQYLNFHFICFLDADLSTSLEECIDLLQYMQPPVVFAFGSRIMKIGSTIVRNTYRFLVGRIIATIISKMLGLQVYDTQCGCKLFTKELAKEVFEKPFISRWLFDVEIFARIMNYYGREQALSKMIEIPLNHWVNKAHSKVKLTYFFRLWIDLWRIYFHYTTKEAHTTPDIAITKDVLEQTN